MPTIIGLDPGLRHTGWGIVKVTGNALQYVAHGVISPSSKLDFAHRLNILHQELQKVITQYQPEEAAVEETFVNMNASSTLKLGMARGVVLLVPAQHGLKVAEYATNSVKKTVVGVGHATKDQVALMVERLLYGCKGIKEDAADALAVAICHVHTSSIENRWKICA
ncbi:MAG: crossover junction endodeoxyribonuclease RuvC [Caedibacter sp. 38-128]|nr:crossover junction endodeoxyribonuclease RuvC [Holosporales bacterium]OJX07266.1 MAG: crossover junction endodeoxyribonuclease RuvC [Caedibacter sp. 38-128]